jgi:hypothetical protein
LLCNQQYSFPYLSFISSHLSMNAVSPQSIDPIGAPRP